MTPRDVARTFILRTNRYWPFSKVNRIPYWIAIRSFVRGCRKFREIKSVYLRHPLVNGQWIPATSDIDLTVILDRKLPREAEFSFLNAFWLNISKRQKIFPMLGEVELMSEHHLESWSRFGIEGQGRTNWELLAGSETKTVQHSPDRMRFSLEAFDCAFWFYLQQMTDLIQLPPASHFIVLQDLFRVQRKIDRCLARIGVGKPSASPSVVKEGNLEEVGVLLKVLEQLENGLYLLSSEKEFAQGDEIAIDPHAGDNGNTTPPERTSQGLEGSMHWARLVRSIRLDDLGKAFVILHDHGDTMENRTCIDEIRRHLVQQGTTAVILTENLFAYYLRYLKPYEFGRLLQHTSLIYGEDSLKDVPGPTRRALAHELLKETPLALMFPQSQEFILWEVKKTLTPHHIEYKLDRTLALRQYLESGKVGHSIAELLTAYDQANPQHAAKISSLRESIHQGRVNLELFAFFKDLIDEIHEALSADTSW